jgi:hypothetical protein
MVSFNKNGLHSCKLSNDLIQHGCYGIFLFDCLTKLIMPYAPFALGHTIANFFEYRFIQNMIV